MVSFLPATFQQVAGTCLSYTEAMVGVLVVLVGYRVHLWTL